MLVTGDPAVRAAHSLQAHPDVEEVVVVGPARSRSFRVVDDPADCDLLLGSGEAAPRLARRHGIPLVWDGEVPACGVAVWGGSPPGLALALASRESDPRLVAVAHPALEAADTGSSARFPEPVGRVAVVDRHYGGMPVAMGRSPNRFAACLIVGGARRVALVDQGDFMAGVALAGAALVADHGPVAVWERALPYLEAVTAMGLVMAESV